MGTPAFRIIANSIDISGTLEARVKSLNVTDESGYQSDTLEIVLEDSDPLNPIEIPPTGAEIEVWLGYSDNLQRVGLYIADEVELSGWPDEMTIRGRAAPYETSKGGKTDLQTQKTRAWAKGLKLGDMVAKIAKEHGMAPAVAASLKSISLPHFDQTDESDLSFLARVGRKYDAIVKPGGGKLAMAKRGESKTASGEDMPTIQFTKDGKTRWSLNRSTRDTQGTVIAYYHSRGEAKRKSVTVGSGDPVRRLRYNSPNEASAKKAAQSELDKRDRRKNKLAITLPGDPTLAAEAKLELVGFRAGVPTEWVVTRVVHQLAPGQGYSCEVEAEMPNGDDDSAAVNDNE